MEELLQSETKARYISRSTTSHPSHTVGASTAGQGSTVAGKSTVEGGVVGEDTRADVLFNMDAGGWSLGTVGGGGSGHKEECRR